MKFFSEIEMMKIIVFLILGHFGRLVYLTGPNSGADILFLGKAKIYNSLATIKLRYNLQPLSHQMILFGGIFCAIYQYPKSR